MKTITFLVTGATGATGSKVKRKVEVAFRFLRHPSRPNAPRPVAKSGRSAV